MKKTILLIVCLAFALPAFSQGGTQLGISGLHKAKKVAKMNVLSASMQGNTWQITKRLDNHSAKIENAAQTGKFYPKAFMKLGDITGEVIKEMSGVYISNYNISSQGSNATETFTVHFNSIEDKN